MRGTYAEAHAPALRFKEPLQPRGEDTWLADPIPVPAPEPGSYVREERQRADAGLIIATTCSPRDR